MNNILANIGVTFILIWLCYRYATRKKSPKWLSDLVIPQGWAKVAQKSKSVILFIEKTSNRIANISVDISPQFLNMNNQVAMQKYSPTEILEYRWNGIQNQISSNPSLAWQNFKQIEAPNNITLNSLSAAQGIFAVEENILGKGTITPRKIRRVVIYAKNDIFDVVFASTDTDNYTVENKVFDEFLNNLTKIMAQTKKAE